MDQSDVIDRVDESPEAVGVLRTEFQRLTEGLRRQGVAVEPATGDAGVLADAGAALSPNFNLSEFHCHDGTPVPAAAVESLRRLCVNVLQPMRDRFGAGTVCSGYRHPRYNRDVGGAPNSYHVYEYHFEEGAVAADVTFASGSPSEWAILADQLLAGGGGVGIYTSQWFVHVDNGTRVWRG